MAGKAGLTSTYLGSRQLEGPQEVGSLLERWPNCVDLMHKVLNADDVVLAQSLQEYTNWKLCSTSHNTTSQRAESLTVRAPHAQLTSGLRHLLCMLQACVQTLSLPRERAALSSCHSPHYYKKPVMTKDLYLLNNGVVNQGDAALVDLAVSSLIHELLNCLQAWVTPGNVRLNTAQHVDSCLIQLQQRKDVAQLCSPLRLTGIGRL